MLKILGRTSSLNVRKVLWTCDELGLAYEREDWGTGFASTRSPEFLALNPNGLVPVLIDEQGALYESNTICRYLAARFGHGHLLPLEPRPRAGVEQWMDWQATTLNPTWGYAFLALGRPTPGYDDPARIAASVEAWNKAMAILDQRLQETGAHAAGHDFTLADVVLGVSVHRWKATPMARAALPAVEAYYARLKERPEFGRWALDAVP
ncbi:glutathione S-transferase [Caulobacter sp. Root487D2Y]|uniref:glutathione S-transferase family protein n=1 Tax=Caulobacter sp. Root487D2Y TaxID=1736547 RepID=UPI0006F3AC7F|nr:glutathione S-transferase [Caulobacter sp. Root487D2Y]KQY31151.1 glutathione S-transferase [Caulobacter sp. Root487D2Y]